jgi:hypothetical protein
VSETFQTVSPRNRVNRVPVRGIWNGGVLKTRRTGDDGHIVGQREVVRAPSLARQLNFGELWLGELRRIPLPRTSVNKCNKVVRHQALGDWPILKVVSTAQGKGCTTACKTNATGASSPKSFRSIEQRTEGNRYRRPSTPEKGTSGTLLRSLTYRQRRV